jgi:hypothetical protein
MQARWKPLAVATAGAIGVFMTVPSLAYNDSWQAAATGNSFSQSTAPQATVIPVYTVTDVNLATVGQPVIVIDRATGRATQVVAVDAIPAPVTTVVVPRNAPLLTTYRDASYNDWMRGDIRTEVVPVTTQVVPVTVPVTRQVVTVPVTRQVYVNDLGQRFVAVRVDERGLTPEQASHIYGNVDSAAGPTLTGTGVQPGNMGPGNAKGQ